MNSANGLDAEGYIAIEAGLEKIQPLFQPVIDNSLAALNRTFPDQAHSVYLYGSVATGTAQSPLSDLDLLVVFHTGFDAARVKRLAQDLSSTHQLLVREVGLAVVALDEVLTPANLPGLGCFIKHLCVCLTGADLRPDLPKFRPDAAVSRGFNGDYPTVLQSLLAGIETADSYESACLLASQLCRKTLRTGFSLVMPRLGGWTTDLDASLDYFSCYYPEKQAEMVQILAWTRHQPESLADFRQTLSRFGTWLAEEFERISPA